MKVQYRDHRNGPWKDSTFGWPPKDVAWLNITVGWDMYRIVREK